MATISNDNLLNEHAVAQFYGVSVSTVRRWRLFQTGPKYLKVSSALVRYRMEDLVAYLNSRPTGGGHLKVGPR
jgi:predicted DNA-binding transcriptional regulator AlpA